MNIKEITGEFLKDWITDRTASGSFIIEYEENNYIIRDDSTVKGFNSGKCIITILVIKASEDKKIIQLEFEMTAENFTKNAKFIIDFIESYEKTHNAIIIKK